MKLKIPMKMKTSLMKTKLKFSRRAPDILLVTGIAGVVGSAVMACVATVKATDILEETKESLAEAKKNDEENVLLEQRTPSERRKDIAVIYAKTGAALAKLYLPSVIAGGFSIFCIVRSNGRLKKQNKELAAAYTALGAAYAEYRRRVVKALGEDADDELYSGVKKKEVEIEATDPETGEVTKKKDILDVVEDVSLSPYVIFFDRSNPYYEDALNGNLLFLDCAVKKAQIIAEARSSLEEPMPLFLNEFCEMIGAKKKPDGQRAGWLFDRENRDIDNAIDARIRVVKKPDGYGGYSDVIMLDPNVDGDVLERWYNIQKHAI